MPVTDDLLLCEQNRDKLGDQEQAFYPRLLTVAEAYMLERQLVPFLNSLRRIQGKRPLLLPGERRTQT